MAAVARLYCFALDCPDPRALAEFYRGILDWKVDPDSDDHWVELVAESGAQLAFQRAEEYTAPTWPSNDVPQQAHLDFQVPDLDEGERLVLALGARKADFQPGKNFRVYLDPAGHPFCLCKS